MPITLVIMLKFLLFSLSSCSSEGFCHKVVILEKYLKIKTYNTTSFMQKRTISVIFILLMVAAYFVNSYVTGYSTVTKDNSFVTRVIDGDTIVIEGGQRIRLLNIDTRERGENCYNEAKERLEELILLKNITIERDKENKDRYDRLLRYVYIGDEMINIQLVREGLAIVYIIEPNEKYRDKFVEAERTARGEGGCVWTTAP